MILRWFGFSLGIQFASRQYSWEKDGREEKKVPSKRPGKILKRLLSESVISPRTELCLCFPLSQSGRSISAPLARYSQSQFSLAITEKKVKRKNEARLIGCLGAFNTPFHLPPQQTIFFFLFNLCFLDF